MDNHREKALWVLHKLNIEYELVNHPAAFTVEDMDNMDMNRFGKGVKIFFCGTTKAGVIFWWSWPKIKQLI